MHPEASSSYGRYSRLSPVTSRIDLFDMNLLIQSMVCKAQVPDPDGILTLVIEKKEKKMNLNLIIPRSISVDSAPRPRYALHQSRDVGEGRGVCTAGVPSH